MTTNGVHPQAAQGADPELELNAFFGKLIGTALGGVVGKKVGGNTGRTIGRVAGGLLGTVAPFEAAPAMAGGNGAITETDEPTELEMQGFWSVVKAIGKVAGKAATTAGQVVKTGREIGLFEAEAGMPQNASDEPNELEMQGFWSVVKKIGKVAGKAATTAGQVVKTGREIGLFEAEAGMPQAASDEPTELEMQNFWKVVKSIGKVAERAVNTAGRAVDSAGRVVDTAERAVQAGRNLGLFQAQPLPQQPSADGIAQALTTVQQALPAIQQLTALLQQQAQQAPARLN